MFGFKIVKQSKKQEVIDAILVLSPLVQPGMLVSDEIKVLVNDKLRDLIKEL